MEPAPRECGVQLGRCYPGARSMLRGCNGCRSPPPACQLANITCQPVCRLTRRAASSSRPVQVRERWRAVHRRFALLHKRSHLRCRRHRRLLRTHRIRVQQRRYVLRRRCVRQRLLWPVSETEAASPSGLSRPWRGGVARIWAAHNCRQAGPLHCGASRAERTSCCNADAPPLAAHAMRAVKPPDAAATPGAKAALAPRECTLGMQVVGFAADRLACLVARMRLLCLPGPFKRAVPLHGFALQVHSQGALVH